MLEESAMLPKSALEGGSKVHAITSEEIEILPISTLERRPRVHAIILEESEISPIGFRRGLKGAHIGFGRRP